MAGRVVRRRSLSLRLRRPWSELQGDLLELILEKLDLADHARFASVCSSWRSVAVNNPPINKPLYMVLSQRPSHLIRRFITSFVPNWKTARFVGAGLDGWLVILIDGKDLFLINKAFNSVIPLPPLSGSLYPFACAKAVLSSLPSSSSSSGECTVVIERSFGAVFYCRLGSDKSFTKLSNIPDRAHDFIFFKEQLYVVCDSGITIFDHLLNKVSQLATRQFPYGSRLLILGNEILAVPWSRSAGERFIFTLEGSKPARVVRMTNVGDNLLLLDNCYCPLSISTKEHKEFRRTNYYENNFGTHVVRDTGKDPNKAEFHDPWPLFFIMFNRCGIKST